MAAPTRSPTIGTGHHRCSGKISGSSLEGSNTDIADEFTKLIVTQQALFREYQSDHHSQHTWFRICSRAALIRPGRDQHGLI